MSEEFIKVERPSDGVVLVTLNRPEAMNAIDMAMSDALRKAMRDAADDPRIRAVILTGAGDKAFSAGYDIREMASFGPSEMEGSFARRDPTHWFLRPRRSSGSAKAACPWSASARASN